MIGLPSLQVLDRAQAARIWLAAEATDMGAGPALRRHNQSGVALRVFCEGWAEVRGLIAFPIAGEGA